MQVVVKEWAKVEAEGEWKNTNYMHSALGLGRHVWRFAMFCQCGTEHLSQMTFMQNDVA